jgi:hypothetical protein
MITFQGKQPSVTPRIDTDTVVLMAERMRELGMGGTAVTADTLFEHTDFTRAEIDEHGRAAADLARARSIRRVA